MEEKNIEIDIKSFKFKEMKYQENRKIEVLAEGKYKNYQFYILNLGTHPTAYVEIPKTSKLYKKTCYELYDNGIDIEVHGGLSYSNNCLNLDTDKKEGWFIGWDYAHYDDYDGCEIMYPLSLQSGGKKWTTKEILEEVFNVIDQIIGHSLKEQVLVKKKFEELGFNYYEVDDRTKGKIIYYLKAKNIPDRLNSEYINFKKYTFSLNGFYVESWQSNPYCERIKTFDNTFITFEEMQAINQQLEVLGCSNEN